MPIKGLTDRGLAFPTIGHIRKGEAKDPSKNQPGADLQYFRVEIDEREVGAIKKFHALYPNGRPTDILVILPFDGIERVWNPWREAYTAGALQHRCDGEFVNYAIDQSGSVIVSNWEGRNGERVKCQLKDNPNKQLRCKPTGRLQVIIPQLERLAYLTLHTTSIHDIGNISDQLAAIADMNSGHIAGIPLILRRRPAKISTPSSDGKRARRIKWLISIEADPEWVGRKISAMKQAALPGAEIDLQIAPPSSLEWSDIGDDDDDEQSDSQFDLSPDSEPQIPPETVNAPRTGSRTTSASKQATIKTQKYPSMIVQLKEATDYYNDPKTGGVNSYHVLKIAAKIGYQEITNENIDHVLADLIQHAKEQQAIPSA